jgi:beta-lactamase regulating signal transducer with metallopeptidase domain
MNTIFGPINSLGKIFIEFALPMLVQSGIVIGILLLAERLLREKVRAVFRYWLGILIFVQLILPPLLISRVNLGYLSVAGGVSQSAASPVITWQGVVFLVWLAVVIVMGLLLLRRAILASRHIRQAKRANFLMNDLLAYCCKCMGVNKRRVQLKISSDGTSPAVYGLFRPVILVPHNLAPSLGSRHLRAVLLHELAHIKRGDLWVNWAQTVLQIVYFYNPLLWLANSMICRVREQAVDEVVLAAMGKKIQRYPEMLADVARLMFKRPALSLGLIGVVESQDTLAN